MSLEVGQDSAIARDMGRSWTTHTGGAGGSKKKGKKAAAKSWASLDVSPLPLRCRVTVARRL